MPYLAPGPSGVRVLRGKEKAMARDKFLKRYPKLSNSSDLCYEEYLLQYLKNNHILYTLDSNPEQVIGRRLLLSAHPQVRYFIKVCFLKMIY